MVDERQIKRSAKVLKRLTQTKYTTCLRYIERISTDEHVHLFAELSSEPTFDVARQIPVRIYPLRCQFCGAVYYFEEGASS